MNKRIAKFLSLTLALVLCLAMTAPAMAAYTVDKTTSTLTTTFEKYFVMDEKAVVPNVQFTFKVAPASGADLTGNNATPSTDFGVFAGVMAGLKLTSTTNTTGTSVEATDKTTGELTITVGFGTTYSNTTTYTTVQDTDSLTLDTGKKYAKDTVTVDFTNVPFPEPGVYRYKITENSGTFPGVTYTGTALYLDVYVMDTTADTDGATPTLKVSGYTLTTAANALDRDDTDDGKTGTKNTTYTNKTEGVTNPYDTYDLKVSKTVRGNQGNREQYFPFTVTINCADDTTDGTYALTYAPNNTYSGNPTSIAIANGTYTGTIYLKHGESFTIENLPKGTTYTISEDPDDYNVTTVVTGSAVQPTDWTFGTNYAVSNPDDGIVADTTIAYTNTRGGVVPTGVLLTIAPFVVLMVVGLIGAVLVLKKKKN